MKRKLIALYREMADLTAPECAQSCRRPHSCCDAMYCDIVDDAARQNGIVLDRTTHSHLKFMGQDGCTVAPHLRPLCTLHTCAINSVSCKPGDPEWTTRYFHLRDQIEEAEWA